jgi:hypothetical protein
VVLWWWAVGFKPEVLCRTAAADPLFHLLSLAEKKRKEKRQKETK